MTAPILSARWRGISWLYVRTCEELTIAIRLTGSSATLPQLCPPSEPGQVTVGRSASTGVMVPSKRACLKRSRHHA